MKMNLAFSLYYDEGAPARLSCVMVLEGFDRRLGRGKRMRRRQRYG